MWESRVVCEISKRGGNRSVVSTARHFHGRSPRGVLERRFQPLPIRLTINDKIVGIAREAIDRALRAKRIGERDEPFVGAAI